MGVSTRQVKFWEQAELIIQPIPVFPAMELLLHANDILMKNKCI